jgi:hypothetical protein
MKKFVFLLIWILSTVSCEKPNEDKAPGLGVVQGFTYIGSTNENLPGLQVSLPNYNSQITDANGYFKFENVIEGGYTISVYQASKFLSSKPINVVANNTTTVWFAFEYEAPPQKDLPDFTPIDLSNESTHTWDYQVAGKKEYFYINVENSLPKSVLYHSFESGKDYVITFDSKGLPSRVASPDSSILLFSNFNGNKVDLGILSPSGESQIIREIKTDFTWPTSSKSPQSRADVIRWTGRILGAIPCVASAATAVATGGLATYLAIWTCGNYFLKLADGFFDDANVENGFTKFVDDYKLPSTIYNCATDIPSCLTDLANRGLVAYADYIEEMDVRAYYINRLEVLLTNNTPPKKIIFQPGSEGKDAGINMHVSSYCMGFYNNSGIDSLISVVNYPYENSCAGEFDKMLLQFSINFIPTNAVISSAQIELYGNATINLRGGTPTISLYALKENWSENDVSWENQPEPELIGAIDFISTGELAWHSWDVTNIVQDWVSGRKNNFGFEIYPANNYVWAEFYSGDNPDATKRPRLVVSYYSK